MQVKHRNSAMPPMAVIRDRVAYDAETGSLTWRACSPEHFTSVHGWRIWMGKFCGKPVEKVSRGYVVVSISYEGKTYFLQGHRVAWALMTGAWPEVEIDHANGARADNRWENLRTASHMQNQWNKGLMSSNRSGFKGVHQHTQNGNWIAQFRAPGSKVRHLGSFSTPELASEAYRQAAQAHHQQFVRFE